MVILLNYAVITALWLSIIIYAALGGADFGGGIWDLFTLGPEKDEQRRLIIQAVGPVWEANNVWLIYLVVGLFTAFPLVASTLATALFIPFSLALIGVVLRGASFAFRIQFEHVNPIRAVWGRSFSIASMIAPFLLGACAGAVASGGIRVRNGHIPVALWSVWLTPFAIVIGLMALALCATLASTYLTVEAEKRKNDSLADIFRTRALIAGAVTVSLGIIAFILIPFEAPMLWHGLFSGAYAIWAVAVTALIGLGAALTLILKRYRAARLLLDLSVAGILGTWGLAQAPYIIPPDLTVYNTASPPTTMWEFLISAAAGMLILIPSLWFLLQVFKVQEVAPPVHEKEVENA